MKAIVRMCNQMKQFSREIGSLLNNYMAYSPRSRFDKTVFFFNSSTNFMHRTGELRGCKLKSKDENKLFTLKNRYIQRINIQKIRSTLNEELQQDQTLPYSERLRISHENFRYRSLTKRILPDRKQRVEDQDMIITSESNSLPKEIKARDLPHFQSSNLQGKMNQYLNLIIKKSHQSHQEKVKEILQGEKQQKIQKVQNMYYRRMKISLNRKKQRQRDSQLENEAQTIPTVEMIKNLKQVLKKPQVYLEELSS